MLQLDVVGHDVQLSNPRRLLSQLSTLKTLGVNGYEVAVFWISLGVDLLRTFTVPIVAYNFD